MLLQELKDGLVLRTVETEADRLAFIELSRDYNNAGEGKTCELLLRHHKGMEDRNFFVVEDRPKSLIVASICLIPWTINWEGVELRAGQLEMVLTHPDYRGRGLVRILMDAFQRRLVEDDLDLGVIWGIPFYYRQFGYSYAVLGPAFEVLSAKGLQAPVNPPSAPVLQFRRAGLADAPLLSQLYKKAASSHQVFVDREESHWRYLLEAGEYPYLLVSSGTDNKATALGYILVDEDANRLRVREHSFADFSHLREVLVQYSQGKSLPLEIVTQQMPDLQKQLKDRGSQPQPTGQWLWRIPQWERFLGKTTPVLERRLAQSEFRTLTTRLVINLFREAYELVIEGGKITTVSKLGFVDSSMGSDPGDLCIPTDAMIRLVTGFRTLEQLTDAWPDILIQEKSRRLIEVLFTPMSTWITLPYHPFSYE